MSNIPPQNSNLKTLQFDPLSLWFWHDDMRCLGRRLAKVRIVAGVLIILNIALSFRLYVRGSRSMRDDSSFLEEHIVVQGGTRTHVTVPLSTFAATNNVAIHRTQHLPTHDTKDPKIPSESPRAAVVAQTTALEVQQHSPGVPQQRQAFTTLHSCQLHNTTVTIPTVPHLIIIGAQKGGTTSMSQWLKEHPQIVPGRFPHRKESHFFHGVFAGLLAERSQGKWSGTDDEFYCWARKRYAEVVFDVPTVMEGMVDGKNPVITLDKTPVYIHLKGCPEYVAKTCPWGVKILVLVRNPVDRAYSQHEMDIARKPHLYPPFEDRLRSEVAKMRRIGLNYMPLLPKNATLKDIEHLVFPPLNATDEEEKIGFEQLVGMPLLKKGLYAIQLREWLKWIPRSDIFIQFYEDLKRDPDATFRQLQQFVGIRNHSLPEYTHHKAGRYEPMNEATRLYLERFFEPYNRQMQQLWGADWHAEWK